MLRLGACEHHLSTDENEQYEFRILQAIYETREELRLVGGEFDVREGKTLEANWKLAIRHSDHVANAEVLKRDLFRHSAELYDSRIFPGCDFGLILLLGSEDNHFTRLENEGSRFRVS